MTAGGCVLVTGGAGYIGSHVVLALRDAGIRPVVLDNLSTGRRSAVPDAIPFVEADVGDRHRLTEVIGDYGVDAVMHFAASIIVPESIENPLAYYRNNTVFSHGLIETCVALGVHRFIYSSSAAVYGESPLARVDEEAETRPINPYGRSKLMTEWMLRDAAAAHRKFRHAALRYFNVAGADPKGRSGQSTPGASNLIKVCCEVAVGKRAVLSIFGDDYETEDGTCVRDFIHVSDLADAHLAALTHLKGGGESIIINCGYGRGFSVREVVAAVERAAGHALPTRIAPRRAGDPPSMVAETKTIRRLLEWAPRYDDLDTIVETALAWEKSLSASFDAKK